MLKRYFINGLQALLPLALTVALVYWILNTLETIFGGFMLLFVPPQYYFWGMGLIAGVVFIFILGIFVNFWLGEKIHQLIDRIFEKIPLIKTIYNAIREVADYFKTKEKDTGSQVVMVDMPGVGKLVGIVMRNKVEAPVFVKHLGDEPHCIVYLPMGYQIGGYSVIIPKSRVIPVDLTVEEGLRFALTAGVNYKDT